VYSYTNPKQLRGTLNGDDTYIDTVLEVNNLMQTDRTNGFKESILNFYYSFCKTLPKAKQITKEVACLLLLDQILFGSTHPHP
jgi:hypothetical protein